jgi:hypothetical protein
MVNNMVSSLVREESDKETLSLHFSLALQKKSLAEV